MLRAAARRLALIFAAVTGGTFVLSIVFGLALGARVTRAISTGYYVVGAAALIGCFVVGSRGPLRPQWGNRAGILPRGVRRASTDERTEAVRTSILLFLLGIVLVVIGTLVDPDRKAF